MKRVTVVSSDSSSSGGGGGSGFGGITTGSRITSNTGPCGSRCGAGLSGTCSQNRNLMRPIWIRSPCRSTLVVTLWSFTSTPDLLSRSTIV